MGLDLSKCVLPPAGPKTVVKHLPAEALRHHHYKVSDLPDAMAADVRDDFYRPLYQFAMDWNWFVEEREYLLDEPNVEGVDPFHLACIAAVVHALCVHNGRVAPSWVHSHKADPERLMNGMPMDSDFAQYVKSKSPAVCAAHGVYFEDDILYL